MDGKKSQDSSDEKAVVKILACFMVKNENDFIGESIESVRDVANGVLIFDTGSTDDTCETAVAFSSDACPVVIHRHGEFVDFATTRNAMLSWAEIHLADFSHFLLMDAHDVWKKREGSTETLSDVLARQDPEQNVYLSVVQRWKHNGNSMLRYRNTRVIPTRRGYRYRGSVHEYVETPAGAINVQLDDEKMGYIFQDRTDGGAHASSSRWYRDLEWLTRDHLCCPENPRTVFYLAQTLNQLGYNREAHRMYELRVKLGTDEHMRPTIGFAEETFLAMMKCGHLALTSTEKVSAFSTAYEWFPRVEPLLGLCQTYLSQKRYRLAYLMVSEACRLPSFPPDSILFVDERAMEYTRWHMLGIIAFYVGKHDEGKAACLKAGLPIDLENYRYYK